MSFLVRLSVRYQSEKFKSSVRKLTNFPANGVSTYTHIQISISPNAQYNKRMLELQTKVTPYKHKTQSNISTSTITDNING